MIKVYIASPYTIGNKITNVNVQIDAADKLIELGFAPYVPLTSHFIHTKHPRNYDTWMKLDFEWIKQCDCLLRLHGQSKGGDMEVEYALSLNIPVFYILEEIIEWEKELNKL